MEWHIIGILAFVVIYNIYRYYHEENSNNYSPCVEVTPDNNQTEVTDMEEVISTRQLALRIIGNICSEPQYTEEGRIQFEYQGITFLMEAVNDCAFVNLIWPWCHSFSKFDIDEYARVQKVVNGMNAWGVVSVFYTETDSDDVAVHLKKHFLFVPQIPDMEEYLRLIMDSFFRTVRMLDVEIEKCKIQECEK